MKRGTLLPGRKNPSLFDTNIEIKEMENVDLALNLGSAIIESGTASVRARPTVKHRMFAGEGIHGFAVPTPTVPELPPVSEPKVNGSDAGCHSFNGSVLSVPDLGEELFIPPPPSTAPPPPPVHFVPPPPDFMGDLNTLDLSELQPPPMPPPKPPCVLEKDPLILKSPPMPPPKPLSPTSCISVLSTPTSTPTPASQVPARPKFAPPQPPTPEKPQRSQKVPPPKPIRLSSVSSTDSPPDIPVQPPPKQTTVSTFNPQNQAKVFSISKLSLLSKEEVVAKPQMLLLEDTSSGNSVPVLVPVEGTPPKAKQLQPDPEPVKEKREEQEMPKLSQLPEHTEESKTDIKTDSIQTSVPQIQPPQQEELIDVQRSSVMNNTERPVSHKQSFSPLLNRKLRTMKALPVRGTRDGHAASPMALLQAAKERDKQRSAGLLSRESSMKTVPISNSFHLSDPGPNQLATQTSNLSPITPTEQNVKEVGLSRLTVHEKPVQVPEKPSSPVTLVKDQKSSSDLMLNRVTGVSSSSVNNLTEKAHCVPEGPASPKPLQITGLKEDYNIPFLPPPPEFGDFDEVTEPPLSICPPNLPAKNTKPVSSPPSPVHPIPKSSPPEVKPKPAVKPKANSITAKSPQMASPSQATLLSILQKKMQELDQNMASVNESENSADDWEPSPSNENTKIPVIPTAKPQTKAPVNRAQTLDMKELENKVSKKTQGATQVKSSTSNGPASRQQYGKSFTIRPGTKQPITPVIK